MQALFGVPRDSLLPWTCCTLLTQNGRSIFHVHTVAPFIFHRNACGDISEQPTEPTKRQASSQSPPSGQFAIQINCSSEACRKARPFLQKANRITCVTLTSSQLLEFFFSVASSNEFLFASVRRFRVHFGRFLCPFRVCLRRRG